MVLAAAVAQRPDLPPERAGRQVGRLPEPLPDERQERVDGPRPGPALLPARSGRFTVPWCAPGCFAIVPTAQPSARDRRTMVARVSPSIAMTCPPFHPGCRGQGSASARNVRTRLQTAHRGGDSRAPEAVRPAPARAAVRTRSAWRIRWRRCRFRPVSRPLSVSRWRRRAPRRLPVRDSAAHASGQYTCPRSQDRRTTTCRRQRPQLKRRPVAHIPVRRAGVDPDAEMPDNARASGPRGRLVRVRRRGLFQTLPSAASPFRPPPHHHSAGATAKVPWPSRTIGSGNGERNDTGESEARPMPVVRLRRGTPAAAGTDQGRRPDRTAGVSQQEPGMGKGTIRTKARRTAEIPRF